MATEQHERKEECSQTQQAITRILMRRVQQVIAEPVNSLIDRKAPLVLALLLKVRRPNSAFCQGYVTRICVITAALHVDLRNIAAAHAYREFRYLEFWYYLRRIYCQI